MHLTDQFPSSFGTVTADTYVVLSQKVHPMKIYDGKEESKLVP